MRAVLIVTSIFLLLVPLPFAAASETFACHEWTVFAGDRETGVGVSADSATFVGARGFYVVNDGAPVLNDWIFSIWFYEETNGVHGLQRGDEVCDESSGMPYESDGGCFC